MTNEYIIKQLSIFAPNTPGTLAEIAKIFQDNGVNISAFCIAEAKNFGVVRAVVNQPDAAFAAFEKKNYLLKFTDVLAVKMSDVPGGLYEVASKFGEAGLNIEYAYASRSAGFFTQVFPLCLPLRCRYNHIFEKSDRFQDRSPYIRLISCAWAVLSFR